MNIRQALDRLKSGSPEEVAIADAIEAEISRLSLAADDQWRAAEQMRKAWRDRGDQLDQLRRLLRKLTESGVTYKDHTGKVEHDIGDALEEAARIFKEARELLPPLDGAP